MSKKGALTRGLSVVEDGIRGVFLRLWLVGDGDWL